MASSSDNPTDAKDGLLKTTLATESNAGLNFWLSFFLQEQKTWMQVTALAVEDLLYSGMTAGSPSDSISSQSIKALWTLLREQLFSSFLQQWKFFLQDYELLWKYALLGRARLQEECVASILDCETTGRAVYPKIWCASMLPSIRATGVRGILLETSPIAHTLGVDTLLLYSSTCPERRISSTVEGLDGQKTLLFSLAKSCLDSPVCRKFTRVASLKLI